MKTITVCVEGCDATTKVKMEVTDAELAAYKKLADIVTNKSSYGCEPTMTVEENDEQSD